LLSKFKDIVNILNLSYLTSEEFQYADRYFYYEDLSYLTPEEFQSKNEYLMNLNYSVLIVPNRILFLKDELFEFLNNESLYLNIYIDNLYIFHRKRKGTQRLSVQGKKEMININDYVNMNIVELNHQGLIYEDLVSLENLEIGATFIYDIDVLEENKTEVGNYIKYNVFEELIFDDIMIVVSYFNVEFLELDDLDSKDVFNYILNNIENDTENISDIAIASVKKIKKECNMTLIEVIANGLEYPTIIKVTDKKEITFIQCNNSLELLEQTKDMEIYKVDDTLLLSHIGLDVTATFHSLKELNLTEIMKRGVTNV
jgi:hypothetical protein